MTTQSGLADVLDGIYDKWVADATLAAMVTAGTLRIFDGPPAETRDCDNELRLGAVGDDFEDQIAISQEWATAGGAGNAERDETIDIPCSVWSMAGNNDLRTVRRTAQTIFNAASTALRGQTLSGVNYLMWLETAAGEFHPITTEDGIAALFIFTVRARTRLTNF